MNAQIKIANNQFKNQKKKEKGLDVMQQKYKGILFVISKIAIKHMDQMAHYYNIKNLNIVFNDNLSFNKYNTRIRNYYDICTDFPTL